jgi:hypothetical protein
MSAIGRLVPKITLEVAEWVLGFAKAGKLKALKQTANVFSRSPGKLLSESKAFVKNAKAKGIQTAPVDLDNAALVGPANRLRSGKGKVSNIEMPDNINTPLSNGGVYVGEGLAPGSKLGVSSGYWNPNDVSFMDHLIRTQRRYHPTGLTQKFPYLLTRKGLKKKPRWQDTDAGKDYSRRMSIERQADINDIRSSKQMRDSFADMIKRGRRFR